MVNEIREYEAFLRREIRRGAGRERLFRLHEEKIREFQHERLVHLLIMLFFVFVAVGFLVGTGILYAILPFYGSEALFILLGILDLILVVLSAAYVRHYYFLENLTQGLYKYSGKILELGGKNERE